MIHACWEACPGTSSTQSQEASSAPLRRKQASVTWPHGWQFLRVAYTHPLVSRPRPSASFASQLPRVAPIAGGAARRSMARPHPWRGCHDAVLRCHAAGLTSAIAQALTLTHRFATLRPVTLLWRTGGPVRRPRSGLPTHRHASVDPRRPRSGWARGAGGPEWLAHTTASGVAPGDPRRLHMLVYGATPTGQALCCDANFCVAFDTHRATAAMQCGRPVASIVHARLADIGHLMAPCLALRLGIVYCMRIKTTTHCNGRPGPLTNRQAHGFPRRTVRHHRAGPRQGGTGRNRAWHRKAQQYRSQPRQNSGVWTRGPPPPCSIRPRRMAGSTNRRPENAAWFWARPSGIRNVCRIVQAWVCLRSGSCSSRLGNLAGLPGRHARA